MILLSFEGAGPTQVSQRGSSGVISPVNMYMKAAVNADVVTSCLTYAGNIQKWFLPFVGPGEEAAINEGAAASLALKYVDTPLCSVCFRSRAESEGSLKIASTFLPSSPPLLPTIYLRPDRLTTPLAYGDIFYSGNRFPGESCFSITASTSPPTGNVTDLFSGRILRAGWRRKTESVLSRNN